MNKKFLTVVVILLLSSTWCAGEEPRRPLLFHVKTEMNFPLDDVLFQYPRVGLSVSGQYVFPFFTPLSVGLEADYQLIKIKDTDIVENGSLSLFSGKFVTRMGFVLADLIELYASGGIGYFITFMNDDPSSWGSNMAWHGEIGSGFKVSPSLTICVSGIFKGYPGLTNTINIGCGVIIRPRGKK